MKNIKALAAALSTILLGACSDSEFDGFKKAENGLHYRFFIQDENGTKVQDGDGLYLRYLIMNHKNDSVVVDSKNGSRDGSGYTGFGLKGSTFKGSLEDGFMMMSKGDSAEFIVPADSFFLKSMGYNELPPGFSSGDHLRALIKIKEVTPKADLEKERKAMAQEQEKKMMEAQQTEKPALEKYIADNNVKVKPSESGVYYIETKKGTGGSPKATDVVTIHYTGKLLDGTVFDSSVDKDPAVMPLNQFIPGWSEGVMMMKKGGKATLIVPSSMAYGPQGTPGGPIPPFSSLVFNIELIDFTANTGAGQQPPPPQGR